MDFMEYGSHLSDITMDILGTEMVINDEEMALDLKTKGKKTVDPLMTCMRECLLMICSG